MRDLHADLAAIVAALASPPHQGQPRPPAADEAVAYVRVAGPLFYAGIVQPLLGAVRTVELVEAPYVVLLDDPEHMGVDIGVAVAKHTGLPLAWRFMPRIRRSAPTMLEELERAVAPFLAKGGMTRVGSAKDHPWLPPAAWRVRGWVVPPTMAAVEAEVGVLAVLHALTGVEERPTPAMRSGVSKAPWSVDAVASGLASTPGVKLAARPMLEPRPVVVSAPPPPAPQPPPVAVSAAPQPRPSLPEWVDWSAVCGESPSTAPAPATPPWRSPVTLAPVEEIPEPGADLRLRTEPRPPPPEPDRRRIAPATQEIVVRALTEGKSIRAAAKAGGVDKNTALSIRQELAATGKLPARKRSINAAPLPAVPPVGAALSEVPVARQPTGTMPPVTTAPLPAAAPPDGAAAHLPEALSSEPETEEEVEVEEAPASDREPTESDLVALAEDLPPSEWDPAEADGRFEFDHTTQDVHARIRDREWDRRDQARELAALATPPSLEDHSRTTPPQVRRRLPVLPPAAGDAEAATGTEEQPLTREQRRSRRHREKRAVTVSIKRMTKAELRIGAALYPERPGVDYQRPRTRGDCIGGVRPCPYVSCHHNLYLDVSPQTGAIKVNFPDLEPEQMVESCALDIADRGGAILEEVGQAMNLTRERVRQIEIRGYRMLRPYLFDLAEDCDLDVTGRYLEDEDLDVAAEQDDEALDDNAADETDASAAPAPVELPAGVSAETLRAAMLATPNGARFAGLDALTDDKLRALTSVQLATVRLRYLSGEDTSLAALAARMQTTTDLARTRDFAVFRALGIRRPHGAPLSPHPSRQSLARHAAQAAEAAQMSVVTGHAPASATTAPPQKPAPGHAWRQPPPQSRQANPVAPKPPTATTVAANWTPGGFALPKAPPRIFETTE